MEQLKKRSKLAEIRIDKNLLQRDIALCAGVSRAFYTQVENGIRVPSLEKGKAMADGLGISLDAFFDALGVSKRDLETDKNEQAATSEDRLAG